MFEPRRVFVGDIPINVLGSYRPWWLHQREGGSWDSFPEHSARTLGLKNRKAPALNYFHGFLVEKLAADRFDVIAVVPSHDPANTESGARDLALRLVASRGLGDATSCLVRHTKIEKLAAGGSRALSIHLNSIEVANAEAIEGQRVLLLDDVMTSGNSLVAGRRLLLNAGAAGVRCIALAKTTY